MRKNLSAPELRQYLERRRQSLRNIRQNIEPLWKDLRLYIDPFRGRFEGEKPNEYLPDLSKQIKTIVQDCCDIMAAGLQSGLTSPSRDWFRLTTPDPDLARYHHVKNWCEEVHNRIMKVLPSAGFYRAAHSLYHEIGAFGTGCVTALKSYDNIIKFKCHTCGTYYAGIGDDGTADTLYRDFSMTAEALLENFEQDSLPSSVISYASAAPDTLFEVRHAIERDYSPNAKFPYLSVYYLASSDMDKPILKKGGFNSFPAMVPRWQYVDGEVYGFGPGNKILRSVKVMQKMANNQLEAINKQVNPPLQAHVSMAKSNVKRIADSITYVNEVGNYIAPLYAVNVNLSDLKEAIYDFEQSVRSAMYVDLFLMLQQSKDRDKSATEAAILQEEKGMMLGPVIENLTSEFHTKAIEHTFNLLSENGYVPPPPQELEGQELKIEYVSVLAQAQKMTGRAPLEGLLAFTGNLAALSPQIMDNLDLDQAVRSYADMVGAPSRVIKDPTQIEAIRAQRQAEQEAEAQAQALERMAQGGVQTAQAYKLLSETGSDTSASDILGTIGGLV